MTTDNIYKNLITQLDKLFRHNRQGSFKTKERYYKAMKRFCRFLAETYRLEKLSNLAPKHIFAYVEHIKGKDLSASTIKTDLSAIRFWHDQMPNARHKLPSNEALDLERRSFGKQERAWSDTEYSRFISICLKQNRNEYAAAAHLARYVGLRIHECFRIDTAIAEDAIKNMAITIKGKGGKIRAVPIDGETSNELKQLLAVTGRGKKLFLPEETKSHRAINNLQQFIVNHRSEIQNADSTRPLTFHGLRHAYAQEKYLQFIKAGKNDSEAKLQVSKLLGHEREDVTRIYLAGLNNSAQNG